MHQETSNQIVLPRSDSPTVSIVIATTSQSELLQSCLTSVADSVDRDFPMETILVLNDPSESVAAVAERVTGARIEHSPVNLGFGGAINLGASLVKGEFLLILHDDTRVEPGWLDALVETARRHEQAGAVGGKVLSFDGSLQAAGWVLWRDGTTTSPWIGKPPPATHFDEVRAVDYCSTSTLLVKRATWDRIGGFDERLFPAHYIDVDLCMSIRKLGQVVLCDPRCVVNHRWGASSNPRLKRFITLRNQQEFCSKWREELEDYEPWQPGSDDALSRAFDRTERTAELIRARYDRSPADHAASNGGPLNRPQSDPGLSPHQQRCLLSAFALKDAYAGELSETVQQHEAELERREAVIDDQVGLDMQRQHTIARLEAENRWLHERNATLGKIESGGWWRLRSRLLPLAHAAGSFRRRLRRS